MNKDVLKIIANTYPDEKETNKVKTEKQQIEEDLPIVNDTLISYKSYSS